MNRPIAMFSLLPAALLAMGALWMQDAKPQDAASPADQDKAVVEVQLPSYPLTTCPISGEPLGDEPVDAVRDGRLVRLCCKMCARKVKQDDAAAADAIAKVDAAVIAAQKATYPLKTCPVSDEPLEDGTLDVVHGTRLVRLCCKGCKRGFDKDPAKTMAAIDAALIAQQLPTYPLKTCLVSGEELGSGGMKTADVLYGTRLVRLCCKACTRELKAKPDVLLAKLDAAVAARKADSGR